MPSRTCSSAIAAGGGWFGRLLLAAHYQIGLVTAIDGRIDRIVDNFSVAPYRVIGLLELAGPAGVGIGLAYIRLGAAAAAGLILLLTGSSSSGACPTRRLVRPRFVVPEAVASASR